MRPLRIKGMIISTMKNNWKKYTIGAVAAVFCAGGIYYTANRSADTDKDDIQTNFEDGEKENSQLEGEKKEYDKTEAIDNTSQEKREERPEEEAGKEKNQTESGKPLNPPVFAPEEEKNFNSGILPSGDRQEGIKIDAARDPALTPYWEQADAVASSAHTYYTENYMKTRIITKNGYLYNKAADFYVNVDYLYQREDLETKYRYADAKVLLVYGSDMSQYEELKIGERDMDLTAFAALKHPTEDKYLIASSNGSGGVLPGDKYRSLLGKYSQNHGTIRRLYASSPEYERIINFIRLYDGNYDKYFVRSVVADDKYAMVTLSDQKNSSDLKQYILVNDNNFWEVVMEGIADEPRPIIAVNKKLPDFNLNMLPKYCIYDYRNSIMNSFGEVVQLMVSNNYIGSLGDIYYIAGAEDYCYAVTVTGVKYLGRLTDGSWQLQRVDSSYEAQTKMTADNSAAPTFILLDD